MNNILAAFKRFLKNKNIVTIVGVIIILVLLYFGYSTQINSAVNPVKVAVATDTIQPRTLITADMVKEIDVPNISVNDEVYRGKSQVIGKYSNVNTMIPKGSMFFKDSVIEEKELPDYVFIKTEKNKVIYNFPVNMNSTYGNSMFPGNYVDIYMKIGDGQNEKVMIGKLLTKVKILAIKDSSGRGVFENTSESRVPAMMFFGLSEYNNLLLKKASYLSGVELYPVPNGAATEGDQTEVPTQQLVDYINAHAVDIPTDDEANGVDYLIPTINVKTVNNKYVVTITYPEGCGTTYTCTYSKNNGKVATVSKKTAQSVTYDVAGTLVATVTEKDNTVHKLETTIPEKTNSATVQVQ